MLWLFLFYDRQFPAFCKYTTFIQAYSLKLYKACCLSALSSPPGRGDSYNLPEYPPVNNNYYTFREGDDILNA